MNGQQIADRWIHTWIGTFAHLPHTLSQMETNKFVKGLDQAKGTWVA